MLEIRNLSLQRGTKVLLHEANISIYPKQRIGLIGKNGTGKSSLFALILEKITQDKGDISLPKQWKIASVAQETPALDCSCLDFVLQGDQDLQSYQASLDEANLKNDGEKIALYHQKLDEIDAYSAPSRAAKLLSGLGFSTQEHTNSVKTFSGGWRMRLNLAQALMCRADLLLLDEPTNHLDLETVLWLENYLYSLNCTQIIISHDKDFLDHVTNYTIELANQKLTVYSGNYSFYLQEKAKRLALQQAAYIKQQNHIKHLQSFIDRFRAKATKASQAQSRIKALAKLEVISQAHIDSEFHFEFITPAHLPNPLLKLEQANLGYDNTSILNQVSLSLESGSRYGLLGVNGSGKSTFIKTLAGILPAISGQIIQAEKLNIGYFAQHQLDILRADQSPIQHIQVLSPEIKEQDIRNFLGGFHFTGNMAVEPIIAFSGGEKARLALAILVWQKPNLLLLDEPTNHLDLDMRHTLTWALQSFQGAMILVSHDRSLLESTCDSFLLIEQGQLKHFNGSLEDYRKHHLEQTNPSKTLISSKDSINRKTEKRLAAQKRQELSDQIKPWQKMIHHSEQEIKKLSTEKEILEVFLNDERAYNEENKFILNKNLERLRVLNQLLIQAEEDWLDAQEKIEIIQASFEE